MKYSTRNLSRIAGGLFVAGLLAAGRAGAADTATAPALSSKGVDFVKEASRINMKEIELAQLAKGKSQNPDVKALAEMIQEDHQQSEHKLTTIAQEHGLTLNQNPNRTQHREEDKLAKLSGTDFDQQYTKAMLQGHVAAIKRFESAAQEVPDPDVKQYIQETLPHLQHHLQHSETAAKSSGVDQATISSITKGLPGGVGGTGENQEHGAGSSKQQPY
jgi:putative membrane protein